MTESYTREDSDGGIILRTENSHAAYTNESGEIVTRESVGIIRFDEDGCIWVTLDVSVDAPDFPEGYAVIDLEMQVEAVAIGEIGMSSTLDSDLGSNGYWDPEHGLDVTPDSEIGMDSEWTSEIGI